MTYQFGNTRAAKEALEVEARAREKLAELRRLEAELDARMEAAKKAVRRLPKVRTYAPTTEQIRAWETRADALPEPQWGGQHNLYLASLEAATWNQTHRRGKKHAA